MRRHGASQVSNVRRPPIAIFTLSDIQFMCTAQDGITYALGCIEFPGVSPAITAAFLFVI